MKNYSNVMDKCSHVENFVIIALLSMLVAFINMLILYGLCYLAGNEWLMNICETVGIGIGLLGSMFSIEIGVCELLASIYIEVLLHRIKKGKNENN